MTTRRPRVGVMGGTFDPVHHGHLVAASEVAARLDLDEVVFVPTGRPSLKDHPVVTEPRAPLPHDGHRHGRQPAVHGQPRGHRPAGHHLHRGHADRPAAQRPDADLYFITGADAIAKIASWKDVDRLWSMAQFVAVTRPGHRLTLGGVPAGAVTEVEVPALSISSTDCRRRARAGEPVWYLVPDGVVQYIAKHGLYRGQDD